MDTLKLIHQICYSQVPTAGAFEAAGQFEKQDPEYRNDVKNYKSDHST